MQVVLAYSGGLDTSVILKWLQDEYNCEVVTFTADLGQVHCHTYVLFELCVLWELRQRCALSDDCGNSVFVNVGSL